MFMCVCTYLCVYVGRMPAGVWMVEQLSDGERGYIFGGGGGGGVGG